MLRGSGAAAPVAVQLVWWRICRRDGGEKGRRRAVAPPPRLGEPAST
ncbi:hypothetical protein GQ55_9G179900 [Panicum hallii var. hallii]|uniref:Uncharacterized protein n=1 Tax=Panicum hallii var. hallii TaxID=1504633 RepID=A0A2T7C4F8_9POAL|nr:hypothetical protein GQ55_9G179900 [Panicum hallii var. hallii]